MTRRLLSLALIFAMLFSIGATVNAVEEAENSDIEASEDILLTTESEYEKYISDIKANNAKSDIKINSDNATSLQEAVIESYTDDAEKTVEKAVVITPKKGSVTYKVNIEEEGFYNINLNYSLKSEAKTDISFEFRIDGELPFVDCQKLIIPQWWVDESEKRVDNGNEYVAMQVQYHAFSDFKLMDDSGISCEPYKFYFSKGEHTVTFSNSTANLVFSDITLKAPKEVANYSQIKSEYKEKGYKTLKNVLKITEGETAIKKTSRAIVAKSDNSSAVVTPSSPYKQLLNYIGGSNWAGTNDEVVWEIEVPESGLYNLGFSFKQDTNVNMYSYRWLKIDGETPFKECTELKFPYSTKWQTIIFGNDKEKYQFYLEKGKHTLSLTSTLGDVGEYYKKLEETITTIGDIYLEITMITGETPDANRDYELFRQLPDLEKNLKKAVTDFKAVAEQIKKQSEGETNSLVSAINNMVRILQSMIDNPYTAHLYVADYYSNYTTVSSWLYDIKSMPLSIDQIQLASSEEDIQFKKVSIFKKIAFAVLRFIYSFSADYNNLSSANGEGAVTLKIWVNWGRDQAQVLNSLIQESFVPLHNGKIQVNLELTSASLVKGMLSNNAPDLSLHLARTEPVNLAMRGALYDLTQFSDYEEVIKRFGETASMPYEYGDGVYALPDTQSFYIMFYRSDILNSLGIEVPETWDQFLDAASILQRNNMNAWIPYTQITAAATVNTGVGGLNLFASILQQNGGEFYNKEKNKTLFDSNTFLNSFTQWTEMYTQYKLPTTATFYNRFRTGTMPLGIEAYTLYTTLYEAAPEIDGRWGIALVPGTRKEDGTVDHTVSGSGTGCAILNTSENKEAAWEFLKWWTSDETQLLYNNNVESIIGTVSRVTTANLEAFSNMSWKEEDLEILLEQRSWIKEIPEVPGSYFVTRSVDQSFWSVVNNHKPQKKMLEKWGDVADREILRKIEEYSD